MNSNLIGFHEVPPEIFPRKRFGFEEFHVFVPSGDEVAHFIRDERVEFTIRPEGKWA